MNRQPAARLHVEALESRDVPAPLAALDPSFDGDGKLAVTAVPLNGVALQADGKIVVVGGLGIGPDFIVARFNPNGTADTTFDGDGVKTIDFGGIDRATSVAIQADGKIVVAGVNGTDFAVARLNPDGSLDATFDNDGKATVNFGGNDVATAVALQADGKIVVVGSSGTDFAIVRLNGTNGALDTSFDGDGKLSVDFGGNDVANAVSIQADGKIVVAGAGGGVSNFALVRLNATNGSLDGGFDIDGKQTVDFGGTDVARGMAIQPNGAIVVAGSVSNPGVTDFAVARLTAEGALDASFDTDGKQTIDIFDADDARQVLLQSDGRILVVGDTQNDLAVVRLTAAGAPDATFDTDGRAVFDLGTMADLGTAAALTPGGRLVVAGQNAGATNGTLIRVTVELEQGRTLAVGGSLNGRVSAFVADPATGQFNPTAATVAAFGTTAVNARGAVADVNGDGFKDAIVVTGPGVAIRLAVVSGRDFSTILVPAFDPFGGNFTGGGFVTAGDFDADGRAEVVITPDQGGGSRVSIFSLGTDGTFAVRANFFGIDDAAFRGGARAGAGDINGDGVADLAVSAGFLGGPRIALFDGNTLFTNPTRLIGDFFAFETTLRNGTFVTVADVDGDGRGDLVFGAGPGGAPRVLVLGAQQLLTGGAAAALGAPLANFFVAGNTSDRGGVRVAAKDVDGDNRAEVVVGSGERSTSRVRVYFGATFGGGEPAGFQDLDPFAGAVLANGVFVG